jgi:hypothetical protein
MCEAAGVWWGGERGGESESTKAPHAHAETAERKERGLCACLLLERPAHNACTHWPNRGSRSFWLFFIFVLLYLFYLFIEDRGLFGCFSFLFFVLLYLFYLFIEDRGLFVFHFCFALFVLFIFFFFLLCVLFCLLFSWLLFFFLSSFWLWLPRPFAFWTTCLRTACGPCFGWYTMGRVVRRGPRSCAAP